MCHTCPFVCKASIIVFLPDAIVVLTVCGGLLLLLLLLLVNKTVKMAVPDEGRPPRSISLEETNRMKSV